MTSEKSSYHPTVWRTCRALKNANRLACLRVVLKQPGLTVGEVARKAKIPPNQASINLRMLQSRGLISSEKRSRWTHYTSDADPFVEHAEAVRDAFAVEFFKKRTDVSVVMARLRAFTHSRRLAILAVLSRAGRPVLPEALVAQTRISLPAVWRHLHVLETAGLVCQGDTGWELLPEHKRTPLVKTMLGTL
jgi:DNA-binding transcriptional ArsR family regulator